MIDLRSDTLTRPTEAMREAMARAEVGDDVYGEDPTVTALQERVAGMFGHEAALFTPTGSMANVLAVASRREAGRGGAVRVLGPHRPGRARRPRRDQRDHHAHLDRRARSGRPPGDRGDVRPRHGPVLRPHRCRLGREHPQLRRRRRPPARRPARPARLGRQRRHQDPPRRRAALERPRRDRHAARRLRPDRRRARGLPVQGARRARSAR